MRRTVTGRCVRVIGGTTQNRSHYVCLMCQTFTGTHVLVIGGDMQNRSLYECFVRRTFTGKHVPVIGDGAVNQPPHYFFTTTGNENLLTYTVNFILIIEVNPSPGGSNGREILISFIVSEIRDSVTRLRRDEKK
ncbi:hypothetical protein AVEN_47187-1 [Araneus ventricosus]|uniref:Uncharacterized protein n=1 Tax=Araneus ventricosus TaxID=182803 RepID=A0A4Y2EDW5_ARAVE|nr:hypothetical protein AVEN_47187-1 [Araneus ventricosus]